VASLGRIWVGLDSSTCTTLTMALCEFNCQPGKDKVICKGHCKRTIQRMVSTSSTDSGPCLLGVL